MLLIQLFEEELKSAPFPSEYLNPPLPLGIRRLMTLGKPWVAAKFGLQEGASENGLDPGVATQVAIARQVVKSLNEAKGLPVKVAQMLGYFDFHIPYAVREVFSGLRSQGVPMNPLAIAKVVQEELGAPPSQIFRHWEATPFAAASIGQVHRATLKTGERVAVKVQYPGVRETIESDIRSISLLGKLAHLVLRGGDAAAIVTEIREHLLEECDYELEASRQTEFRKIFSEHSEILIPEVFKKYSTGRVLVSAYHEGVSLEHFATHAPSDKRNRIGEIMWDFFNIPKFKQGLFHCDPHSGNFLVHEEKLVCFDFGCVKKVSPEYHRHMIGQALGIVHRDPKVLRESIEGMGIIHDHESFNFEAHFHFVKLVGRPYLLPQPFRYSEEYGKALWHAIQTNPNQKHTQLPREEVMALRCHLGELANYTILRAESDWRRRILGVLASSTENA